MHIDTGSISRNVHVDIPIVADALEACEKVLEYAEPLKTDDWVAQIESWKIQHPLKMKDKPGLTPQKIIQTINDTFEKAIVVTDVGQHQMFTTQYLALNENKQLLTSGGLGTMGYGFPGAIGAKIGNPDTTVIMISQQKYPRC